MVTHFQLLPAQPDRLLAAGLAYMNVFFGLGSNMGNRRDNLRRAINMLQQTGTELLQCSPVIETPALLPKDAPSEWNQPFLNMVVEMRVAATMTPEQMRAEIANIQHTLGRNGGSRWSPRPMDVDILLWGEEIIETESLTIPHRDLHIRHFVLTPMLALRPLLQIPGKGDKTLLDWSRDLPHHIPLWMGILNITPDSFSDGGDHLEQAQLDSTLNEMLDSGVNILDIGGESTRPGAQAPGLDTEWARLEPVLNTLRERFLNDPLRPLVSLDTWHPQIASRALAGGPGSIDFINDVGGLTDPTMIELASDNSCQWIAMHNLGVPADSNNVLATTTEPAEQLRIWLDQQLERWDRAGIDRERIIFDPGIGFGKNSLQSLKLLQAAGDFRRYGLRLLVGHSRKSFMQPFTRTQRDDRDMVTIGASMHLCQQGVDIIRVHNIPAHISAYRGWSHLAG